jgi:hypothetical protein
MRRVVILGGAGAVGMRVARLLAEMHDVELMISGRDHQRTTQFTDELAEGGAFVRAIGPDDIPGLLARENPALLIDVSAGFHGRSLAIPQACVRFRVPYIDVAADAGFSQSVRTLNAAAIAAGVPVLSGAGISPCVTFAAIDAIAASMTSVEAVRVVMCPGNQQPFGPASFATLLARAGKRFQWRRDGKTRSAVGWQHTRSEMLPEIGRRAVYAMETPEIALVQERWPDLREATAHASLELSGLQISLRLLSFLARRGVDLTRHSAMLETLARTVGHLGSKRFVLRVALQGRSGGRELIERSWTMLADDGGRLAATPAITLARRILRGPPPPPGARIASVTLSEIRAELQNSGLDIRMHEMSV